MRELRYPPAERLDLLETLHGHAVADPYRWLEDTDSAATKEWATAQDGLYSHFATRFHSRDWFADHVRALLGAGTVGSPVWRGERRFHLRRTDDQEHAVLYVQDGEGPERVLLDPGALDSSGLTTLDSWRPDHEGRLLAYQLSEGGDEESVLRVMDVDTGETVDGPIDRARYSPIAWLPDGSAFYYVRRLPADEVPEGEESYHRRVYLHRLGASTDEDVLIFGSGRDKTEYFVPAVSRDGRWLLLSAVRGTAPGTDAWIADLSRSGLEAPRLVPVQQGMVAALDTYVGRDGRLYLQTDRDAPRGRLCVADPAEPGEEHWTTLVAEDPEAVMEDFAILDGPGMERPELLVAWSRHAIDEVTRHDLATGERWARWRCPVWARSAGCSNGPRAATSAGSATPTARARRRCTATTPARAR